jgi:hypothetical protein
MQTSFTTVVSKGHGKEISKHFGEASLLLVRPSGSLKNRIAVITDCVIRSPAARASMLPRSADQEDLVVPYGLREMGLNITNTLIRPFNLRQFRNQS